MQAVQFLNILSFYRQISVKKYFFKQLIFLNMLVETARFLKRMLQ